MLLSANMIKFHDTFGMRETFDIFANAGVQGMDFNNDVPEYCTDEHDKSFYVSLGNYAREKKTYITNPIHYIIESPHPSPFSARNGFFGSKPFSKTNEFLKSKGIKEINWNVE